MLRGSSVEDRVSEQMGSIALLYGISLFYCRVDHDELHLSPRRFTPRTLPLMQNGISLQVRYPEDIQIIIRADTHTHGSLFLSNLEAAQNPQLLQSTPSATQNSKSQL